MITGLQGDRRRAGTRRARRLRGSLLLPFLLAAGNACLASPEHVLASPPPSVRSLGQLGWTVADFDGDSQPDMAITKMESRGGAYVCWLEIDLSTKRKAEIQPDLPGAPSIFGLHLLPRDVDGDHKLDLIVTLGFARQPVAVWINDGQGGFAEGDLAAYLALAPADGPFLAAPRIPRATLVPYDQGRRSRFAILLGRGALHHALRSDSASKNGTEPLVSRLLFGPAPARGPPSGL